MENGLLDKGLDMMIMQLCSSLADSDYRQTCDLPHLAIRLLNRVVHEVRLPMYNGLVTCLASFVVSRAAIQDSRA
jgi:hypothetical protein